MSSSFVVTTELYKPCRRLLSIGLAKLKSVFFFNFSLSKNLYFILKLYWDYKTKQTYLRNVLKKSVASVSPPEIFQKGRGLEVDTTFFGRGTILLGVAKILSLRVWAKYFSLVGLNYSNWHILTKQKKFCLRRNILNFSWARIWQCEWVSEWVTPQTLGQRISFIN